MNKNSLAILIILTASILSACTGAAASPTASTAASSETLTASYQDALSAELQLALGTLKLEESAASIDRATASTLLPLWKAARALSQSDATSALEMNALFSQIEQSMTADQLAAIAAMQLTTADLAQQLASLAPAAGTAAASSSTSSNVNTASAGPGGGQMPPYDMSGGAPAMPGGADVLAVSPSTQTTPSAVRSSSTSGVPAALLNAVISLLEGKV